MGAMTDEYQLPRTSREARRLAMQAEMLAGPTRS
jgi:hypothetical protein